MQCPQKDSSRANLMIAWAAGSLEPQEQIELERHLAVCPQCSEMAGSQKAVWDALDVWRSEPVSSDFNERVYRRIACEEAVVWWRRPLRNWSGLLRPAVPLAAATAALCIAFVVKEAPVSHEVQAPLHPKVSIEQVERALDDMDLLKQLSAPAPPTEVHARGRI